MRGESCAPIIAREMAKSSDAHRDTVQRANQRRRICSGGRRGAGSSRGCAKTRQEKCDEVTIGPAYFSCMTKVERFVWRDAGCCTLTMVVVISIWGVTMRK